VDDAGRRWAFAAPPERIVSLVPAATGILLALGEGDRIVGRTEYDLEPELAGLPSVGGGLEPSIERLLALAPDLVIRYEGPSDRTTAAHLDRAGIPHLAVRPDTIGDIFRILRNLGAVVGRGAEAEALVAEIEGELAAVSAAVEGARRPRVVILLGGDPPWVSARATFLHELVERAGATNVFGSEGPLFAPVSVEEILARTPERVVTTPEARIPPGLRSLPVIRAPATVVSPGAGVGRSAREIARLLHPERFP
jgi:iron complex transport system substrate-binding protein